jgi:ABC-type multidrug transport system ATPase subunit
MDAIDIDEVSHRFGTDLVLDRIRFRVREGAIHGFLGPNGAGKSTTLRLVLGLLRRQHGSIRVFGCDPARERAAVLRKVGSSIESPSIYADLSARENLQIWRLLLGCPANRVDAMLERVGLADTRDKRAGRFSLGMKQRLALGIALLGEPRLLLLDEPTNGLDPEGILAMREFLLRQNREFGTSLLVSSHVLPELERLVDGVTVIHRGRVRYDGTLEGITGGGRGHVRLRTSDAARAMEALHGLAPDIRREGDEVVLAAVDDAGVAAANARLVGWGIDVHAILPQRDDLESAFLALVREDGQ